MKKLLFMVCLAATAAVAQDSRHYSFSFLPSGIDAVYVTNTLNITNLSTSGSAGTNLAGTTFTNLGTRLTVTNDTGADQPLLLDVPLWIPKDGRHWQIYTNFPLGELNVDIPANVSVTYDSGSGANAAVTLVFVPVVDDTHEVTANQWTWSFTAVASQTGTTISTNALYLWQWPGAKKVRIRRIVNADTDATSHVIISGLKLNGYK